MSEKIDFEKSEEELRIEILKDLKAEFPIEEEVKFNEFNIQSKLQNHAYVFMNYHSQLDKAKTDYNKMLELKDKIVGERYHYYRFNYEENLNKPEIEKYYLTQDPKILKINKLLRIQELRVEFFSMSVKALDKMGWNMKNFLESCKTL